MAFLIAIAHSPARPRYFGGDSRYRAIFFWPDNHQLSLHKFSAIGTEQVFVDEAGSDCATKTPNVARLKELRH